MATDSIPTDTSPLVIAPPVNPFRLLADPEGYVACQWDLTEPSEIQAYWINLFRTHLPSLLATYRKRVAEEGGDVTDADRRAKAVEAEFFAYLDTIEQDPGRFGRLDIITICWARERALRNAGTGDVYRLAKKVEDDLALKVLPSVLEEHDAIDDPRDKAERVLRGVFAGNIFDLGATETLELFEDGGTIDFRSIRSDLRPRPWLIDDLDPLLDRLDDHTHRAALLMVDNAGSDIVLGMIPLARLLLQRGTEVILAANDAPSLNDITVMELKALMRQITEWDPVLRQADEQGWLEIVGTGNGVPLIDLGRISDELNDVVERRDVDLCIVEGMGRAVESNLDVKLTCDRVNLAMIKDRGVATSLGGEVYDLVLRYEPA